MPAVGLRAGDEPGDFYGVVQTVETSVSFGAKLFHDNDYNAGEPDGYFSAGNNYRAS
jgi:hypothetical protein